MTRQTDEPLTAEQSQLVAKFVPLAWKMANAVHRRCRKMSAEELFSVAALGLSRAAANFDPSRGVVFMTCAANYIGWYLHNYWVDDSGHREQFVASDPTTFAMSSIPDRPTSEDGRAATEDERVALANRLSAAAHLTGTEKALLLRHLVEPATQQAVADEMGVSKQAVNNHWRSIYSKIRTVGYRRTLRLFEGAS